MAVMQGIFNDIVKSSGRALMVLALSVFCTVSFGAGHKTQGKRVTSPAKFQMVKQDRKADKATETLSEEEIFNRLLQQKNISADGKTLTDSRDGKEYSVEIRGEKAWMKNNLAFSISTPSQCLMESAEYCQKYGRFYSHQEAKKACPSGWQLPDDGVTTRRTAAIWIGKTWARADARTGTAIAKAAPPAITGQPPRWRRIRDVPGSSVASLKALTAPTKVPAKAFMSAAWPTCVKIHFHSF